MTEIVYKVHEKIDTPEKIHGHARTRGGTSLPKRRENIDGLNKPYYTHRVAHEIARTIIVVRLT